MRKQKRVLQTRLDEEFIRTLKHLSVDMDMTLTEVVELFLQMGLRVYQTEHAAPAGGAKETT